jgi:hypothetical protein
MHNFNRFHHVKHINKKKTLFIVHVIFYYIAPIKETIIELKFNFSMIEQLKERKKNNLKDFVK